MKLKALVMTVITLALGATLLAQDQARERKLQQAIDLLETKGDAARAMPLLDDVAKSADQALAARGLLYLGQAQERGGIDSAKKTYERIIRQFGGQTAIVDQAKARLSALGSDRPSARTVSHRLLWSMPEAAYTSGNVSRNGRQFLYTDRAGDLQLRDLTAGTTRTLVTHDGDSFADTAALSPDGQQIAFGWYNHTGEAFELHVAKLAGGGVTNRRAIPGIKGGWVDVQDWSSDGKLLAVHYFPGGGNNEIDVISVADGARRTLKAAPKLLLSRMAFSPDGAWLAVDLRAPENGAFDIYLLSVGDGLETAAVTHRADDRLVGWSADGRLLFTSDRSGAVDLYAQDVKRPARSTEPLLVRTNVGVFESRGVSADRDLFSTVNPMQPVTDLRTGVFDFSEGRWLSPPTEVVGDYSAGINRAAEWSPDGRLLAYVAVRGNNARGLYRVNVRSVATGRVRELKPRLSLITAVQWTPGSDALLVSGTSFEGRTGLWRLDLETDGITLMEAQTNWGGPGFIGWSQDGAKLYLRRSTQSEFVFVEKAYPSGSEREVMREPRAAGPATNVPPLSPDGKKMYYRRATPGQTKRPFAEWAVIERDIASGTEREVTRGQLANLNLSPDGRFFATGSNDVKTGTRALVLVPTDGSEWRVLLRVPLPPDVISGAVDTNVLSWGGWAPDSRSLFFRKIVNGKTELWWMSLDAPGAPKLVDQTWRAGVLRTNVDGRSVVFQTQSAPTARTRELWVFENLFHAEPKKEF